MVLCVYFSHNASRMTLDDINRSVVLLRAIVLITLHVICFLIRPPINIILADTNGQIKQNRAIMACKSNTFFA
jgi:hypothetical protein